MENSFNPKLKRRVMIRVYGQYWKVTLKEGADYIVPVFLLLTISFFVSIPNILSNFFSNDFKNLPSFIQRAVIDTEAIVQILLSVFVSSFAVLSVRRLPKIASSIKPLRFMKIARV